MQIDTLAVARDLKAVHLPAAQAEAIAAAIGRSTADSVSGKADLDSVVQRLEAMEQRLTAKIESSRSSTITWMVTILTAAAGLFVALGHVKS